MRDLVRLEPQLAKITGYNVKIVESSGTQLARLFQRVYSPRTCHWDECPACAYSNTSKKPPKCRVNNVVYEAVCIECEEEAKDAVDEGIGMKIGRYVGETSRTLAERSKEHIDGAKNCDYDNFIIKHWVNNHSELPDIPRMRFRVLKSFQDALSRLATEGVLIESFGNMKF